MSNCYISRYKGGDKASRRCWKISKILVKLNRFCICPWNEKGSEKFFFYFFFLLIPNFVQGCKVKCQISWVIHNKVTKDRQTQKRPMSKEYVFTRVCTVFDLGGSSSPHIFFFTQNPLWLYPSQPHRASLTGNPSAEPRQGDANSGTSPSNHSRQVARHKLWVCVCGLLTAPVSINHNARQWKHGRNKPMEQDEKVFV